MTGEKGRSEVEVEEEEDAGRTKEGRRMWSFFGWGDFAGGRGG